MAEPFTTPKWTRLHHNAIAKEIRELFPADSNEVRKEVSLSERTEQRDYQRGILVTLALNFAKRFVDDNPNFKPLEFLDACSPNTDLYPLSELWEDNSVNAQSTS